MIRYLRIYVLLVFPITVYAQGGHYWTESFGSRSMLLNGVVIGSVEDLGAVYYNPARISQLSSPAFVISGQVYEYKKTNIKDGLGDGIDLKQSNFGSGPSLVSGTFKLKFLEGHHFAYAFLTRTQADNTFNFSINKFGDFIEAFPGEEYFSGEITSTAKLKDEWIGLSWSYPINEKLSVGFSGFYSGLNRDVFLKLQLQAYKPDSANTGMYIEKRAYSFKTNGILGKLGVSWQDEKYSIGLTVTTPKLQGLSSGTTNYETFLAGIDTTGNGVTDDVYIIDGQKDLAVNRNSPWAIGIGGGIKMGRSILHLSAEWFSAVQLYKVLESEPFIAQSTGAEIHQTVVEDLQSVLNYGLGLEVFVNEKVSLFGSFATDFSASTGDEDRFSELKNVVNNTTFRADIYHMGFGTDIKTKFANLTIGATYANSKETVERKFEIDEVNASQTENADIRYSRWLFLLGFEFPFLDKAKKKLEAD